MTLRTDGHRRWFDLLAGKAAENLRGFSLDLLFFTADVRQDVVENVERGNAGVARAWECLQGGRDDGGNTERRLQRRECEDEHDGRAVRIRDDEAARRVLLAPE